MSKVIFTHKNTILVYFSIKKFFTKGLRYPFKYYIYIFYNAKAKLNSKILIVCKLIFINSIFNGLFLSKLFKFTLFFIVIFLSMKISWVNGNSGAFFIPNLKELLSDNWFMCFNIHLSWYNSSKKDCIYKKVILVFSLFEDLKLCFILFMMFKYLVS